MARPKLRKVAASQAHAEYAPQKAAVRRSVGSQVRSIRSEQPALEHSLSRSAEQLRHANLSPRDLAIALSEVAHRTADVGASTALQVQQAMQQGHGELVDLNQAEGQAQRAALAELQNKEAERVQGIHDEEAAEQRKFKMDLLEEQAKKRLGLGDYSVSPKEKAEIENLTQHGGLTPTQQHAAEADHANAAFYAKSLFKAAKSGEIEGVDPDPRKWTPETWSHMIENVKKRAGVDIPVAERAVGAIRDHADPGWNATSASLLDSLATVAGTAGAALAPRPLQPIAQFGNLLLHHR